jgi:hypothetical protein
MKAILFTLSLFGALTYLTSCKNGNAGQKAEPVKSKKYILLIDLSDRLLQPNQVAKDSAVITAVFEAFLNAVDENMIIQSRDKFVTRILYQKNSTLDFESYSDSLSVDLANFHLGEKKEKVMAFEKQLPGLISRLYQRALLGNDAEAFEGVDIWQYFNEQVTTDIDVNCKNNLVVLTDGYFDFNNMGQKLQQGNYYSTTLFLNKLTGPNWRAESSNTGLIPVKLPRGGNWLVCGISSKNPDDQLMNEKLSFFWKKWLEQSTGERVGEPVLSSSPQKMQTIVKEKIQ